MLTTQSILDRYVKIRCRPPEAPLPTDTVGIGSLLDIPPEVEAFVFDTFGGVEPRRTPDRGRRASP